ncbi:MAG: hypothetical protein A2521_04635 [Deltaproteobacteria bacterium RIFOXYD12_FULL_57_12]|nr:MAG: hypothetical protein A2521_04635 [Deltaproteobacteria bacterium RIFOXYD12_FULL_57_12]
MASIRKAADKPYGRAVWLTIAGMVLVALADYAGLLAGINDSLYDLSFRLRGARQPSEAVILAAIDEKTLARLGQWPINRVYYAQLLDALHEADGVGLAIILAEPAPADPELDSAITRHGRVVLPVYIDENLHPSRPLVDFSRAATGHVHLEPGVDGVVRKVFHTISCQGESFSSFASALYTLGRVHSVEHPRIPAALSSTSGFIQGDERRINFYGPPGRVPAVSMIDILDKNLPSSFFKNKLVLVGVTAAGIEPGHLTPFNEDRHRMSGVELHAQILNNLLDAADMRQASAATAGLALLLTTLFFLFLFVQNSGVVATLIWLVGLAIIPTTVYIFFRAFNLWVPPASFYLDVTIAFAVAYIVKLEYFSRLLGQAKEDWEASFNAIDDAIIIHDQDGAIAAANMAAEALPPTLLELLQARCFALIGGNDCPPAVEADAPDIGRSFAVKSFPRFDPAGGIDGMVQVVRDITDLKRSAAEQRKLEAQLIQTQKMESIGRLAGGVAHDFNNLLTAILGYSELALMKLPEGHEIRENLLIIKDAGDKAAALTRQLLAFSRKQQLKMEPVNLNTIISHMGKMLQRLIGEDVALELRIENEVSNVFADLGQIEQILMNLVVNGRDAMPSGGTLWIETADVPITETPAPLIPELVPGPYVVLTVSDTGIGMSPEVKERIFEPFFSTKAPDKGTGLGLATVYGIVKQHNGGIHVYSEIGKGTVFKIFLPVCQELIQERPIGDIPSLPTGKETVLVAEDNAPLRKMIVDTLASLGYRILEAARGEEALQASRAWANGIDLLLTDVIMPGMNGKDLADTLQRERPSIKVLFMSGYTADFLSPLGILETETLLIQKPFTPSVLAGKVRQVLDRQWQVTRTA